MPSKNDPSQRKNIPLPSLQKPEVLFFNGALRPWEDAVLHFSSEGVQRGLNVFEGLKAVHQPNGHMALIAMPAHYKRLCQSARLLHMPFNMSYDDFLRACRSVVDALSTPEKDMWLRPTLYMIEGHWGQGDRTDLIVPGYQHPKSFPNDIKSGVSTWQRASDLTLPARIKTAANYQVARLVKIEGRSRGYPEMVLLNRSGRVAEFIGSALLMVRDGIVVTPPPSEGCIESITVDILEELAIDLGIEFVRRPIERTELVIADEIGSCGTLNDITVVSDFDERPMGEAPTLTALRKRYRDAIGGIQPHKAVELS